MTEGRATRSRIPWTTKTLNPVHGCSKVSAGCLHCYAETMSRRFGKTPHPWAAKFAAENVQLKPERLHIPFRYRLPELIFVDSMSDQFHELVPFEFTARLWAVMALTPQHTYQILTKRPERMRDFFRWPALYAAVLAAADDFRAKRPTLVHLPIDDPATTPLPNVWLGTSVEDQAAADSRIPVLIDTPAAVRFLSCEPLLGPLELGPYLECGHWHEDGAGGDRWRCVTCGRLRRDVPNPAPGMGWLTMDDVLEPGHLIDWVIAGGESGHGARRLEQPWLMDIRDACRDASVPFFMKQFGSVWAKEHGYRDVKGEDPDEWPAAPFFNIREFPHGFTFPAHRDPRADGDRG